VALVRIIIGATILYLTFVVVAASGAAETSPAPADVRLALGRIPLFFVPNRGQADSAVRFLGRGPGGTLLLYDDATLVAATAAGIVLRQSLIGGSRPVRMEAADPLGGRSHFFLGRAQDEWQTDVPHFSRITYRDVYPGIDLVYHGNAGALQYDWTVAPGADPGFITLAIEGPTRVRLDEAGHLLLDTAAGTMRVARPVAYQVVGGTRRGVEAAYVLDPPDRVRYAIRAYDPRVPLVIDPILQASTYLGGDGHDVGYGIAVDSQRNVYVTGETRSPNFPLKNQVAGPGGELRRTTTTRKRAS
jgi:Beta-propeller repeat